VTLEQADLSPIVRSRNLTHAECIWSVREIDARGVPGARGETCLIFEWPEAVRRVWTFPRNWWELDDEALWLVRERAPQLGARLEARRQELTAAMRRSMEAMKTAQNLLEQARAAVEQARTARSELAGLLQSCRAERQAMHAAVDEHTAQLRDLGLGVDDAATIVVSAVHEAATHLTADEQSVAQIQRDAKRWCQLAYRAA
jgi:hypothetical protein